MPYIILLSPIPSVAAVTFVLMHVPGGQGGVIRV